MEISVLITRDSVFRQVARRMEWEGARGPLVEDDYGRVAMSEADRSLFHQLFDEAAMHAIDICRPFLAASANTDEALKLLVCLPDEAEDSGLSMAIGNMVAAHVLAQWQEIVNPSRASASYAKRDDYASKALSFLYHHPAPRRSAR